MIELGERLGALSREYLDLLFGGDQPRLALLQLRALCTQSRIGLLGALHRAGARLHQFVIAGAFFSRKLQIGFCGVDLGRLLLDQRLLQFDLRFEVLHRGFRRGDVGAGLVQRGLEITVVDPRQHLTVLDRLVVRDQHIGDVAGNLRRDDRGIGFDIGVIGRF
jgi:hypothetical protein